MKKLTRTGNNLHLYFTENSFTLGKNEIIFLSDRAADADRTPHEDPLYNLFRMDLDSGKCWQLTEETASSRYATKTPVQHFQFSPDDPTLGLFCHEGPWNLVTQRMWLLDLCSGRVRPCFRQGEEDSVGHEFWTQDGLIFFDDRGPGLDGTITPERRQAVREEVPIRSGGVSRPSSA